MNFIRNTLRYKLPGEDFRCDIVMGVPVGYDQAWATAPYYRSTYALVYPKGKGLDEVRSGADLFALPPERRSKLTIGIHDKSPASMWLVKHGLEAQAKPYQMLSPDPDQYPGPDSSTRSLRRARSTPPSCGVRSPAITRSGCETSSSWSFRSNRSPVSSSTMRSRWACGTANANGRKPSTSSSRKTSPAITAILREYSVPLLDDQGEPIN